MKKLFILLATAVMVLPFAISCEKKSQPVEDVVMSPAATAEVAKTVSFENIPMAERPQYAAKTGTTYEIVSIEFTEDSRYAMRRRPVIEATTKADATIEVVTGKFTFSNGGYTCQGDFAGTVQLGSNTATVTPQGGQAQTASAQVTSASTVSVAQTNASRTWKVDNCIVKISGNSVSIDKSFNGCNFNEIANYAASNGVKNIDASKLAGYNISEFIFTGQNTMVIVFTGADNFYGSYKLNGNNFSYTLENGNDLMGTTATGTMSFPADKKAELSVTMGLKGYTGTIEFFLSQAAN